MRKPKFKFKKGDSVVALVSGDDGGAPDVREGMTGVVDEDSDCPYIVWDDLNDHWAMCDFELELVKE